MSEAGLALGREGGQGQCGRRGDGLKAAILKPKEKGSKWVEAATCNSQGL